MAQSQKSLTPDETNTSGRWGRHKLDRLDAARVARHLVMFHPNEIAVADLVARARTHIPGLADVADVLRVVRYNPECIFAIARKSRFNPQAPMGEGFIAMLPLTAIGMQHLAMGTFNGAQPDLRLIAPPGEKPEGLYIWGVYAPGPLAAGSALFMEAIAREPYAGVNLYTRPNTDVGERFNTVLGLTKGAQIGPLTAPDVWVFERGAGRPPYDSYIPGATAGQIGITIARSFEDLMRVTAIRSAVYIGEQECPYEEEFDGNDIAGATHLMAYIGDEPAGCLRVRFFADFAKIERLAIRKEFRKSRAAFQLVRAGLRLCQSKGYRRAYGHSQMRLVSFWSRFGFRQLEGAKPFVFSDFDYVEMVADLERDPDAVTIGVDPYVIIRPEGRWHQPGILERSASRAVTQPSVARR